MMGRFHGDARIQNAVLIRSSGSRGPSGSSKGHGVLIKWIDFFQFSEAKSSVQCISRDVQTFIKSVGSGNIMRIEAAEWTGYCADPTTYEQIFAKIRDL
jgi:hypothetical protein